MILKNQQTEEISASRSKLIDRVKSDDLRTMLATYYTLSKDNAPTPEEI